MAGLIPDEIIEKVRAASDIVEVIQSYLPLKRAGSSFKALCPFHQEKTPSFHVHPGKQIFYCFGCHKGGDVFKFIQEYERVSFYEAVRRLAERAGIQLELPEDLGSVQREQQLKKRLYELLEKVTIFWHRLLLDDPRAAHARQYLERRRLSLDVVKAFRLGYAPAGWTDTLDWAKSHRFSEELLEMAGLVIQREGAGGFYDRFRDRLIFPISDGQGRVVGFSGRILNDAENAPKYINTPETVLFRKGQILFGLDRARMSIARSGIAIVCEGQMDLIRCHMHGLTNVVSPLGTALTRDHCRLLQRYAREVVLCFDADPAGQKAAARSFDELLESNLAIRVVVLPEPHDPDSFISEYGPEAFQLRVEEAPGFFDWLIEWWVNNEQPTSDRGRRAILNGVGSAVIKTSDPALIDTVQRKLAVKLGMHVESVAIAFERLRREVSAKGSLQHSPFVRHEGVDDFEEQIPSTELWLLKVLLADPELVPWAVEHIPLEWVTHPGVRSLLQALYAEEELAGLIDVSKVYRSLDDDRLQNLLARLTVESTPISRPATTLADIARKLELAQVEEQIRRIRQALADGKLDRDTEAQLLSQLHELGLRKARLSRPVAGMFE